jgi:thiol-disulfide isomerase/thioredoxin
MYRFISILALCFPVNIAIAAEPRPADKSKLDGVWVFDSVKPEKSDDLNRVWMSIVVVEGDAFTVSSIMRNPKPLKGKLVFDRANSKHVDITIEELDFSYFGGPFKLAASKRKALFEFVDENRIRFAFPKLPDSPRPKDFKPATDVHVIELCRAPKGFKEFPKEIMVTVVNADDKPVEGAIVAWSMNQTIDPKRKDAKQGWQYAAPKKTGPDGKVKTSMVEPPFVVRDENTKEIALPKITPATLASGAVRVVLAPECRLVSSIKCDDLTKDGKPLGWTNTLLYSHGSRIGGYSHPDGKVEFLLPPGTYTLDPYGESLQGRHVEVTVPAGQSTFEMKPIELKCSALALLKGKPAPEFAKVAAWAGKPVKLADLKGQYVLVEFWGYWCSPCVAAMPVLIELHEKFHDKGLTVIGVHVDIDGDVDTVAKFDEMNSVHVKRLWKGKKLPFPNALVSGKRESDDGLLGQVATQYGVLGYPTTVLIDREGRIVGKFHARDIKAATAAVEKLLAGKK